MANFDLKAYREAKTIGPHIDGILKVIYLNVRALSHFQSYLPVIKILKVMDEQKTLLELHKKHYDEILKTKGQF